MTISNKIDFILRIIGILISICLILVGVFCFNYCQNYDPNNPTNIKIGNGNYLYIRDFIVSVILIIIGIFLCLSEIHHWLKNYKRINYLLTKSVYFLKYKTGRGIFYIIGGFLALTRELWMIIIGIISVFIGILNLIAVFSSKCCNKKSPNQEIKTSEENPSVSLTNNAV